MAFRGVATTGTCTPCALSFPLVNILDVCVPREPVYFGALCQVCYAIRPDSSSSSIAFTVKQSCTVSENKADIKEA